MAQVANTWDTYDSKRNREQLANDIDLITPEETPFYSMVSTKTLEGTHPEWNLDVLNTPNTANRKIEGDVWSFATPLATSRVGNYTQISDKEFIITDTQEAVSAKAGPKSDVDREMMKAGMELRIDLEVIMLSNQASLAGNNTTARQSAGARAWIATNDLMGATGASGGFNTGTGIVDAAGPGTQRAFTKALLDAGMSGAYTSGGRVDTVLDEPLRQVRLLDVHERRRTWRRSGRWSRAATRRPSTPRPTPTWVTSARWSWSRTGSWPAPERRWRAPSTASTGRSGRWASCGRSTRCRTSRRRVTRRRACCYVNGVSYQKMRQQIS